MESQITARVLAGEVMRELAIIDMHCHMDKNSGYYFSDAHIEQMVEDAERVGIAKMCAAPHVGLSSDHALGNRQTAEAIEKYPDRVLGMVILNPNKPEDAAAELDAYYPIEQFVGVKLHPAWHQYPLTGPAYLTILEQVADRGGLVLLHSWEPGGVNNAAQCEEIAKRFPHTQFILAHALGVREGVKKAVKLAAEHENVYLDSSGFEFSDISIEWITAQIPADKMLFGSDCPYHDVRGGLSRILLANLSDDLKRKILRENYLEVLQKAKKK